MDARNDRLGMEIRVTWMINNVVGGGLWFPKTAKNTGVLSAVITDCNERHGADTHMLDERPA